MPLIVGEKELPNDISLEALLEEIAALPPVIKIESMPGTSDSFSEVLQVRTIGVHEKGYVVTSADSQFPIAGTDRLFHCIGISLYERSQRKLAVAHLDCSCDAEIAMRKLSAEFSGSQKIEVCFFGGLAAQEIEASNSDENKLSIDLRKALLRILIQLSHKITIIIRHYDCGDKTWPYKFQQANEGRTKTLGFAIDSRDGEVICLRYRLAGRELFLPYGVVINNFGFLTGAYYKEHIPVRLHRKLFFDGENVIANRYNSTIAEPLAELLPLSRAGIILLIKELLISRTYPIKNKFVSESIENFIDRTLGGEFGDSRKCLEILRDHITCQYHLSLSQQAFLHLPEPVRINETLVSQFINRNGIYLWLQNNCRIQLNSCVQHYNRRFDALLARNLSQLLFQIPSSFFLAKASFCYIDNINSETDIFREEKLSDLEDDLVIRLANCTDISTLRECLLTWHEKLFIARKAFLIDHISKKVSAIAHDSIFEELEGYFNEKFSGISHTQLNIDVFDSHFRPTEEMADQVTDLIVHRIRNPKKGPVETVSAGCCGTTITQNIQDLEFDIADTIDGLISQWADDHLGTNFLSLRPAAAPRP